MSEEWECEIVRINVYVFCDFSEREQGLIQRLCVGVTSSYISYIAGFFWLLVLLLVWVFI